jgi:hypothetical protein
MLVFALSALIALQDAPAADAAGDMAVPAAREEMPAAGQTGPEETETPAAEPADAATLVARFENRWNDWNELVGQIAARKAREAYAADLIYPVMARTDLETGARSAFMQAAGGQLARQERQNAQWAVRQLDPDSFGNFHALQPRAARELLRMAMRDETALGAVVAALEPLALAGEYEGSEFADMADRLAVGEGRSQPYGTQTQCVDGQTALLPIAEPDALDARRGAIGLDPLDREALEGAACEAAPSEAE